MSRTGFLAIFSGDEEKLIEAFRHSTAVDEILVARLDEKILSEGSRLAVLVRGKKADTVAFACRELSLQRYQFFMKLSLLTVSSEGRFLIDQKGSVLRVRWLSFFLRDLPLFLYELAASTSMLLMSFIHLVFLKSQIRGNP